MVPAASGEEIQPHAQAKHQEPATAPQPPGLRWGAGGDGGPQQPSSEATPPPAPAEDGLGARAIGAR